MRKLMRKRILVPVVAIAALAVAGIAVAYFTASGTGSGTASVGTAATSRSTTSRSPDTLYPGGVDGRQIHDQQHVGRHGRQVDKVVADTSIRHDRRRRPPGGCDAADFTFADVSVERVDPGERIDERHRHAELCRQRQKPGRLSGRLAGPPPQGGQQRHLADSKRGRGTPRTNASPACSIPRHAPHAHTPHDTDSEERQDQEAVPDAARCPHLPRRRRDRRLRRRRAERPDADDRHRPVRRDERDEREIHLHRRERRQRSSARSTAPPSPPARARRATAGSETARTRSACASAREPARSATPSRAAGRSTRRAPPAPAIVQQPPAVTNQTSAKIRLHGRARRASRYECKVDGVAYRRLHEPGQLVVDAATETAGSSRSRARRDAAGNSGPATTYSVEDRHGRAAETAARRSSRRTRRPPTARRSRSPTERPASSFECALDGAAYAACTKPQDLHGPERRQTQIRACARSTRPATAAPRPTYAGERRRRRRVSRSRSPAATAACSTRARPPT